MPTVQIILGIRQHGRDLALGARTYGAALNLGRRSHAARVRLGDRQHARQLVTEFITTPEGRRFNARFSDRFL